MVVDKKTAKLGFAARLGSALTAAGIPDNQKRRSWVAETFKVSVESARKWLMGESMPDTARIEGIARRLGVGANWLLSGAEDERNESALRLQEAAGTYDVNACSEEVVALIDSIRKSATMGTLTPALAAGITAMIETVSRRTAEVEMISPRSS